MAVNHSLVLIGGVVSGERIRIVVVEIITSVRILEETEILHLMLEIQFDIWQTGHSWV